MLASTIQFTNTPRPTGHPRSRQTPATHGPMRQPAPQPPKTTTPTPQPPPTPTGGGTPEATRAGPVPSGPNSAPTPPPRTGPRGPSGPHRPAPTRPEKRDRRAHAREKERGVVCDVSTHERSVTTRIGGVTALARAPPYYRHATGEMLLRKEVIQPHLPVRLPCYDFVPIASPTFDHSLPLRGWAVGFGCYRLS